MTSYLVLKIWPFHGPGYWGGAFATHASLCNTLSSNKLCPKTVKILAVKGLMNLPDILLDSFANNVILIQSIVVNANANQHSIKQIVSYL